MFVGPHYRSYRLRIIFFKLLDLTRFVTIRQNLYHDNHSFKYHDNWIITIFELLCSWIPKPNFWSTNWTSVRNCQGQFQVCNVVLFKIAPIVGIYLIGPHIHFYALPKRLDDIKMPKNPIITFTCPLPEIVKF